MWISDLNQPNFLGQFLIQRLLPSSVWWRMGQTTTIGSNWVGDPNEGWVDDNEVNNAVFS